MTKPNHFYKFRQVDKYSLSALASCQLWFDRLSNQNDPFEGECLIDSTADDRLKDWAEGMLSKPTPDFYKYIFEATGIQNPQKCSTTELLEHYLRAVATGFISDTQEKTFICSLSSSQPCEVDPIESTLMWGHYAEGLRGFCLVFDEQSLTQDLMKSSNNKAHPIAVEYSNSPRTLRATNLVSTKGVKLMVSESIDSLGLLSTTSGTKSKHWEMENEVRVLSFCTEQLLQYKPESLVKVVCGDKMPTGDRELIESILSSKYPNTKIETAKVRKDSYRLTFAED
ncbi:hypothetical protein BCS96_11460 [Vibrio breoganii]|uniref:DUF2971 domain-containing protein n=1 Tax=Vibrio breoganii TaxID=553239 RepID=UPI000C84EBCF|nr:DUF2971 domain-containing protein [Vibrio breoganii]PMG31199.1 hypothetical protein BCU93_07370 [Vibrio breoganii]PMG90234.1 hypothetical protein BCU81_06850 [Vibrio breoganii]PML84847.1 hypothetical protein BCT68_00540 [Vibrio breoganii]PMM44965.1 hypothetical protein BCT52_09980 [Vibrio breoganii]PMO92322.1 hypothetical protein BCS98_10075 [Vibrio breoganii]